MKPKVLRALKVALPLLVVIALVIGWTQRWDIYDWYRLRGYDPHPRIAQLASDTTMTNRARHVFYVYHPELNDKASFNANCKTSERTIVLGCYVTGQGIFVYNVTDERLAGVLQVTAAHEMLHAVYDRLSPTEKPRVTAMVDNAYKNLSDQRIRDTIDDYRANGADITNELHSILGTEVRNLPTELEDYYAKYFADRSVVVGYSERYEQAFTERKAKVAQHDTRLDQLKKEIDAAQASLDSQVKTMEQDRQRLDALLAARNYEQYNAGVASYNAKVSAYNNLVRRVRQLIDEYNTVVAERNAIALEESELVKAIDSRPDTIENH